MLNGKTYEATVTAETEHHSAVGGHGEQTAVIDADDDQYEQDNSSIITKAINKDL